MPLCPQLTASEEEFLRTYAGVVNSQLSQLPQHSIDQGEFCLPLPSPGTAASGNPTFSFLYFQDSVPPAETHPAVRDVQVLACNRLWKRTRVNFFNRWFYFDR